MNSDILVFDQKSNILKKEGNTKSLVNSTNSMARIKIKNKTKGKKSELPTTQNEKHKEGGKIYKFAPQTVGQKNKYATFATIKEKIIQRAQVELSQGYDVKRSLEEGKEIDFDLMKPELEIIDIEEIMAESDGV